MRNSAVLLHDIHKPANGALHWIMAGEGGRDKSKINTAQSQSHYHEFGRRRKSEAH